MGDPSLQPEENCSAFYLFPYTGATGPHPENRKSVQQPFRLSESSSYLLSDMAVQEHVSKWRTHHSRSKQGSNDTLLAHRKQPLTEISAFLCRIGSPTIMWVITHRTKELKESVSDFMAWIYSMFLKCNWRAFSRKTLTDFNSQRSTGIMIFFQSFGCFFHLHIFVSGPVFTGNQEKPFHNIHACEGVRKWPHLDVVW